MDRAIMHVALISLLEEERLFYQKMLAPYTKGVNFDCFLSLNHLKSDCQGKTYSGIIIDIFTLVCASTAEKSFFASLQKGFPVLQIRRSAEDDEISCTISAKDTPGLEGQAILDQFLSTECRKKPARGIRIHERRAMNTVIRLAMGASENPVTARMTNLSQGGCYVCTPLRQVSKRQIIWIGLDSTRDPRPIGGTIRWKEDRAEDGGLGLGIQFEELSNLQQVGIAELLHSA